jgi:hypothetical protein
LRIGQRTGRDAKHDQEHTPQFWRVHGFPLFLTQKFSRRIEAHTLLRSSEVK